MTLPTGTVTFWMTDVEGSTRLLRALPEDYPAMLAEHHRLVREAVERHDGTEVSTEGDSFFCVFRRPGDAVAAAARVQRSLATHPWPAGADLRVRVGVHTGEGRTGGEGYVGLDVHRTARVAAAGHGGQVLLSSSVHALLDGAWPGGLSDVRLGAFRLKDLPAPEILYQLVGDGLVERFGPLRTLDAPAYDLPPAPSPLAGRQRESADVAALLAERRLVTLTGPGGVGKTRLALHVAEQVRDRFGDGVVLVPLAEVRDERLVADEIARALALPAATYGGLEGVPRLAEHLAGRRMLLVLDNVEQLAPRTTVVADLLAALPGISVLATSRSPLRLRSEQEYPVGPLPADDAVRQFLERARAVRPDQDLGPAQVEAVRRVVEGVGGLPLAVELAASRTRTLSPAQVADRLGQQLSLLRGGARDLPDRQQTLRSTLRWSYDLLDADARAVFGAFAVLPAGATLEAVEALAPAAGATGDPLDALEQIVDQGLVQRPPDAGGRFRTLQVVRELAAELLDESGRAEAVQRRQATRLVDLVEAAEPLLVTVRQREQLDLLQAEYDNLRASLEWATDADPRLAARLAAPLWRFWQMRGRLLAGRTLLSRLVLRLTAEDDEGLALRARALTALGGVAYWQQDHAAGEVAYAEATAIAERLGDRHGQAEGLYNQAFTSWQQERFGEALERADRAGALFAALGDDHGCARVRWLRSVVHMLSWQLDAAEASARAAVAAMRGSEDVFYFGWALRVLGRTLLLLGRPQEARPYLRESLQLFAGARDISAVVLHLADFATLAGLEGDFERQLRLFGAMQHLQQLSGTNIVDHPVNRVGMPTAMSQLGPAAEALLAEGALMDDVEAARYALEG